MEMEDIWVKGVTDGFDGRNRAVKCAPAVTLNHGFSGDTTIVYSITLFGPDPTELCETFATLVQGLMSLVVR